MARRKVKELQELATNMVGDGGSPDLFFVTDEGVVTLITRDFAMAYNEWRKLANDCNKESALENRQFGCIASREPEEDGSTKLVVSDDSHYYVQRHRNRITEGLLT